MDFYFRDLKEEKQREFISKNLAEILCEQRKKDKISMEEFLKRYFDYNIYTKKTGSLSLSQLKRYEKEFKNNQINTIPKKNSKVLDIILKKMESIANELYRKKIYMDLLKKDSIILAQNLNELGLLDCIEKSTDNLLAMYMYNKEFGRNYTKEYLLDWLVSNAKKHLSGELMAEVIYEDRLTRHDIHND
ncbi:hypothetical protein O3672_04180 [Streptococcus chosunense]|jgi:hypothetical protein